MSKPTGEGKLIPDRLVALRYDVHVRTLARWDATPGLGFPAPIYIRRRRYREIEKLDRVGQRQRAQGCGPPQPASGLRAGRAPRPALGASPNLATSKRAERLAPPRGKSRRRKKLRSM